MKAGGAIFFAAAALMFGVAGCGDDDDDGGGGGGTSTEAGITKAEFIEQADELCVPYRERVGELQQEIDSTSDTAKQAELVRELAGEAEQVVDDFDDLGSPEGDEELLDRYKTTAREQIALVRRAADALEADDTPRAAELINSGAETGARLRGIAQGYGFKVCGAGE